MAPKARARDAVIARLEQKLETMKRDRDAHKERADAYERCLTVMANKVETNRHVKDIFTKVRRLYVLRDSTGMQTRPTVLGRLQRINELPAVVATGQQDQQDQHALQDPQ